MIIITQTKPETFKSYFLVQLCLRLTGQAGTASPLCTNHKVMDNFD